MLPEMAALADGKEVDVPVSTKTGRATERASMRASRL
jgi:hypothetical protein